MTIARIQFATRNTRTTLHSAQVVVARGRRSGEVCVNLTVFKLSPRLLCVICFCVWSRLSCVCETVQTVTGAQ